MIRFALGFVRDHATAEEVVQEAWLGVLQGLATFEGAKLPAELDLRDRGEPSENTRCSRGALDSVFRAGRARGLGNGTRGRPWPVFSLRARNGPGTGHSRRNPGERIRKPICYRPKPWCRLRGSSTRCLVPSAPSSRCATVAGHSSESVCNILGITETNMRVLLHRGRSKIRGELERYFSDFPGDARSTP